MKKFLLLSLYQLLTFIGCVMCIAFLVFLLIGVIPLFIDVNNASFSVITYVVLIAFWGLVPTYLFVINKYLIPLIKKRYQKITTFDLSFSILLWVMYIVFFTYSIYKSMYSPIMPYLGVE